MKTFLSSALYSLFIAPVLIVLCIFYPYFTFFFGEF